MRRTSRPITRAVVLAAALGVHGNARANGRYPLANQLVVEPDNPAKMAARATFGLLDTTDGGDTWRWICEDAIGYFGVEDPPIALTANGNTIVASSKGLSVSHDGGCSWTKPSQDVARVAIDVTIDPQHPHSALALESTPASAGYTASLFGTTDDGETWAEIGPLPQGVLVETVEIAPTNSDRVYVSGRTMPAQLSVLLRSDDGGRTWSQSMMNLPAAATAFIGAVDPKNADVVYVRVRVPTNSIGRALVTRDAGESWQTIWSGSGEVAGFALSADGATLAVGGPGAGIEVASTSDMVFQPTNPLRPSCLTWVGSRLLACGMESVDHFSIAVSDDQGQTFVPMLHLPDVTPHACGESTSAAVCAGFWGSIADTIGADAGTDAGEDATPIDPSGSARVETRGCACEIALSRSDRRAGTWWTLVIGAGWALQRRWPRSRRLLRPRRGAYWSPWQY